MLCGEHTHTCTIQRNTPTEDSTGFTSPGWANLATSVPCTLQPASGSSVRTERGEETDYTHRVFFLAGQSVRPGDAGGARDRLTSMTPIRTGTVDSATVYEVLRVFAFDSLLGGHIEAQVRVQE